MLLLMLAVPALAIVYKPALAEGDPARSAFGSNLVVEKGETVNGHVSVTSGNLIVKGEVLGDAIVVFGNADIGGKITGDVYVIGGNVTLRATALVEGEIDFSDGVLNRESGARVLGAINQADIPILGLENTVGGSMSDPSQPANQIWRTPFERMGAIFVWGLVSLVTLALSVVLVVVVPRRVRVASATLEAEGGPSAMLGIITAVLLAFVTAVVTLLLMVTVVGWVLIPVVIALVVVTLSSGLAIVGVWLGRRIYQTTHHEPLQRPTPMLVHMLLGIATLLCSTVVPAALVPVGWVAGMLLALLYVAGCIGLGSILLSRMGTLPPTRHRRYQRASGSASTMPLGSSLQGGNLEKRD
ncbi:MAG TPA: polymer-forming cytoskeletal protein [Chloroflexia bacterium]|nr:polymer-forming cytoskeletal protein [Chloroflexia bacterium]